LTDGERTGESTCRLHLAAADLSTVHCGTTYGLETVGKNLDDDPGAGTIEAANASIAKIIRNQ
jgi:hypothetical protein